MNTDGVPWRAWLLSLLLPGTGQAYAGAGVWRVVLFAGVEVLLLASVAAAAALAGNVVLAVVILMAWVWALAAGAHAYLAARAHRAPTNDAQSSGIADAPRPLDSPSLPSADPGSQEPRPASIAPIVLWATVAAVVVVTGLTWATLGGPNTTAAAALLLAASLTLLLVGLLQQPWHRTTRTLGWLLFGVAWVVWGFKPWPVDASPFSALLWSIGGAVLSVYLAYRSWSATITERPHRASVAGAVGLGLGPLLLMPALVQAAAVRVTDWTVHAILAVFGAGRNGGLTSLSEREAGATTYFYPDRYCDPVRADAIGEYCRETETGFVETAPEPGGGWWDAFRYATPEGGPDSLVILPISMNGMSTPWLAAVLLVAVIAGVRASPMRKLVVAAIATAGMVLAKAAVIALAVGLYGQGHTSFPIAKATSQTVGLLIFTGILAGLLWRFRPLWDAVRCVVDLPSEGDPIEDGVRPWAGPA